MHLPLIIHVGSCFKNMYMYILLCVYIPVFCHLFYKGLIIFKCILSTFLDPLCVVSLLSHLYLQMYVSVHFCPFLSIHPSICLTMWLFSWDCVCLNIWPSTVSYCQHLSVCPSMSVCLYMTIVHTHSTCISTSECICFSICV